MTATARPATGVAAAPLAHVGPSRWRRIAGTQNNNLWFWIFVGPFVIGLVAFVVVPIGWSVYLSLFEAKNTVSPTKYVGFENYRWMLGDPAFRQSLLTFVVFAAFITPLTFVCSLGLALLVNQARWLRGFFRSAFFLPVACSYVVASMVWKFTIFRGIGGVANAVLGWFGISAQQWLSRPDPPLYWVVIVTERLWLQVGFYMLLFLAGLQRIPQVLYEAAAVDGAARGWTTFRHITLPQLRATSVAVTVLLVINAFQAFDEFYNLLSNFAAGSYPPYARPPLVYLYYIALGRAQDFGRGSAGAVILTLMIALFTLGLGRAIGFGRRGDT